VRGDSKVEISRVHGTHVSVAYRSYSHIIGACTRTRDGSSMESRQRHASLSIEDYNAQRTASVASWYVVKCQVVCLLATICDVYMYKRIKYASSAPEFRDKCVVHVN
jgi:hypothetical protein